ncbi:hypothetical protein P3342_012550 [Pyrenophora teres f. teres]|nr:hypothetical protein P3342_012550 [Pyrenophora teres f. teres]
MGSFAGFGTRTSPGLRKVRQRVYDGCQALARSDCDLRVALFEHLQAVFIAHSVLSAIWLLRETLADNALSDDAWNVCAAESLAQDGRKSRRLHRSPWLPPQNRPLPHPTTEAAIPICAGLYTKRARTTTEETLPEPSAV